MWTACSANLLSRNKEKTREHNEACCNSLLQGKVSLKINMNTFQPKQYSRSFLYSVSRISMHYADVFVDSTRDKKKEADLCHCYIIHFWTIVFIKSFDSTS
jgi:hypothetical protein